MRLACILVIAAALGACARTEDIAAQRVAALQSRYVGRPLSEFITGTGYAPNNAAPLGARERMFTFEGQSGAIGTPGYGFAPAAMLISTCRISIRTTAIGAGSAADNWRVEQISWSGPCSF